MLLEFHDSARLVAASGDIFSTIFKDIATPSLMVKRNIFVSFRRRTMNAWNITRDTVQVWFCLPAGFGKKSLCTPKWTWRLNKKMQSYPSRLIFSLDLRKEGIKQGTECFYRILWSKCFEEATLENGPGSLFIFSYVSCICVYLTSSERPRFCSGTEVSPVLTRILHFASVTAHMHITKYKCESVVDEKA